MKRLSGFSFGFTFAVLLLSLILVNSPSARASDDNVNLRFSPLGLLIGSSSVSADFKISDDWTVGPTASYTKLAFGYTGNDVNDHDSHVSISGASVGVRANWFANGAFNSGWYVAPSLEYRDMKYSFKNADGSSSDGTIYGPAATLLGGYAWFWDSFNIMLGAGLEQQLGGRTSVSVADTDGSTHERKTTTSLAGEFSLGWKF